ncbi:YodC family protein [Sphingomonas montanisoli]|uniref:DUF2158 domain-containing protein n=1 Tax=Sphingomonas montanisoli TaxID=2606412 RepID=A0A5D9C5L0_9SPHN|nr:DUF2158 domain-containing protein [Sphingomonas montanisoli]TZG27128.1 DUF2158 domain-containing protein [Sphingomonas montanisoli]
MAEVFVEGDIVRLKSGGPEMTVDEMFETDARCVWFAGEKHQENVFRISTLRRAGGDQ